MVPLTLKLLLYFGQVPVGHMTPKELCQYVMVLE